MPEQYDLSPLEGTVRSKFKGILHHVEHCCYINSMGLVLQCILHFYSKFLKWRGRRIDRQRLKEVNENRIC